MSKRRKRKYFFFGGNTPTANGVKKEPLPPYAVGRDVEGGPEFLREGVIRRRPISRVVVPIEHLLIAKALAERTTTEFQWVSKIVEIKNGTVYVSDEILFPKQKATVSSVDFLEQPPSEYDVVFHRHPSGVRQFSSSDLETTCLNFRLSVLYVDGEFSTATFQIAVPEYPDHSVMVTIPGRNIEVSYPHVDVEKYLEKIEVPKYSATPTYYRDEWWKEPFRGK